MGSFQSELFVKFYVSDCGLCPPKHRKEVKTSNHLPIAI